MAASPLFRSLALVCFALVLADCSARHSRRNSHRRSDGQPNCEEAFIGSGTTDVVVLPDLVSDAYQKDVNVNNIDYCFPQNKKLAGALIKACDLFGSPPPSILTPSALSQIVSCHTTGPCSNGMVITVTQYCSY